jgi:hypothetical protein
MRCPVCKVEFEYQITLRQGTHAEHECSACGQILQWDQPIHAKEGHVIAGPPRPCEHKAQIKIGAVVPLV